METPIEGSNPSLSVVFPSRSSLTPLVNSLPSFTPIRPFHYAFFVTDLESTREFYGRILGCKEGRSTESWVDFDFFGNQISAHNTGSVVKTVNAGLVENKKVPMPHFGAVLDWQNFQEIAECIRKAGIEFVLEPMVRYEGRPGEQMTMFLRDPSGNALEFKAFKKPDEVFSQ